MLRRVGQHIAASNALASAAAAAGVQQQQQQQLGAAPTLLWHVLPAQHGQQSSLLLQPAAASWPSQLLQIQRYSQRLNPQQAKKQQKQQKRGKGKEGSGGSAAVAPESTMFTEDGAAMEPDITKLVLQAITNVTPVLDVRTIRTATKVSYVPGLMPPKKARSLALHWLVKATDARAKSSKAPYAQCLALELLLAYQKRGTARQKRDDIHKLALQNRANVHLRWW